MPTFLQMDESQWLSNRHYCLNRTFFSFREVLLDSCPGEFELHEWSELAKSHNDFIEIEDKQEEETTANNNSLYDYNVTSGYTNGIQLEHFLDELASGKIPPVRES